MQAYVFWLQSYLQGMQNIHPCKEVPPDFFYFLFFADLTQDAVAMRSFRFSFLHIICAVMFSSLSPCFHNRSGENAPSVSFV